MAVLSARRVRLFVIALALLACAGCRNPLVGLHDVLLRFAVTEPTAISAEELRDRVMERLAAAELGADVSAASPSEVSVRVDTGFEEETKRLLSWRGGVVACIVDDAVDVPGGALEGSRDDMERARKLETPPSGHLFAIEPVRKGRSRLRALVWPPIAEIDTERAVADGPRVRVPLAPKSERLLAAVAREALVAIVRDQRILAVVPAGALVVGHELLVPLGDTIEAYTRAAEVARLLSTSTVPTLRPLSRAPVAPDWALAGSNLLVPFAMSFAWLFFVRRFDRAQPEPAWLVVATFGLGALAIVPAALIEWAWDSLSPYTNPTLLTFGRSLHAFPFALAGFIVTVGLSEEGAKLLATWSLATHRREFDEPVDGIVYGAAAALGFAAAENVRYLALGRVEGPLVASRAFMSVPAHLFFGTIWGYALGRRLVEPERRVWPLFLAAAALHGLFDTCLSIDGAGLWAFVVGFGVASLFIVHLRLALRHGPIRKHDSLPSERGPRELFRMGSRRVFAAFVVAVYAFSALVFVLAIVGQGGHSRVAIFGASAASLGVLGWAARGVAATLPLDVVVDDLGVTFAGAAMLYRDVVRIERRRIFRSPRRQEQMVMIGEERRLILGPASPDTIDALSHALALRLGSAAARV